MYHGRDFYLSDPCADFVLIVKVSLLCFPRTPIFLGVIVLFDSFYKVKPNHLALRSVYPYTYYVLFDVATSRDTWKAGLGGMLYYSPHGVDYPDK